MRARVRGFGRRGGVREVEKEEEDREEGGIQERWGCGTEEGVLR